MHSTHRSFRKDISGVITLLLIFAIYSSCSAAQLNGTGLLDLSLMDSFGNFIYQSGRSCSKSPSDAWYDLNYEIYTSSGVQIVSDSYADCSAEYYLEAGEYMIKVSGRWDSKSPFISQDYPITLSEGVTTSKSAVVPGGVLDLSLMDSFGNFIYQSGRSCSKSSSDAWYDLNYEIYTSSGVQIVSDSYADCSAEYYLEAGEYMIKVSGRWDSKSPFISQDYPITISEGVTTSEIEIIGQSTSTNQTPSPTHVPTQTATSISKPTPKLTPTPVPTPTQKLTSKYPTPTSYLPPSTPNGEATTLKEDIIANIWYLILAIIAALIADLIYGLKKQGKF